MRLFLEFEKGLVDRRYEKTIIPIDKKKLIYISDLYSFISREFKCKGLFVIKWKNYYIPPKFKIQDILSDNHIIQYNIYIYIYIIEYVKMKMILLQRAVLTVVMKDQ